MRLVVGGIILVGLAALCCADERSLLNIERPVPAQFQSPKDAAVTPTTAQREAVRKQAAEWVKDRATVKVWKASRFEFVGILLGKPADDLTGVRFEIYRLKFQQPPYLGGELQTDFIVYAQGDKMLWPNGDWPMRKAPPPGQMMEVVRKNVRD